MPWLLDETSIFDIEAYLSDLAARGQAPATRNRHLYALKALFAYTAAHHITSTNPARGVGLIKHNRSPIDCLSEEEADEFLAAIERPLIKMATQVLYYTGIRVSEMTQVSLGDVDLKNRSIRVVGKESKERIVPMPLDLQRELDAYIEKHHDGKSPLDRLIATEATGRLSPSTYNKACHETTQRLGWSKKVTAHTFRHTFATLFVYRGGDVATLQVILGHDDIKTTMQYVHLAFVHTRNVSDRVHQRGDE